MLIGLLPLRFWKPPLLGGPLASDMATIMRRRMSVRCSDIKEIIICAQSFLQSGLYFFLRLDYGKCCSGTRLIRLGWLSRKRKTADKDFMIKNITRIEKLREQHNVFLSFHCLEDGRLECRLS